MDRYARYRDLTVDGLKELIRTRIEFLLQVGIAVEVFTRHLGRDLTKRPVERLGETAGWFLFGFRGFSFYDTGERPEGREVRVWYWEDWAVDHEDDDEVECSVPDDDPVLVYRYKPALPVLEGFEANPMGEIAKVTTFDGDGDEPGVDETPSWAKELQQLIAQPEQLIGQTLQAEKDRLVELAERLAIEDRAMELLV